MDSNAFQKRRPEMQHIIPVLTCITCSQDVALYCFEPLNMSAGGINTFRWCSFFVLRMLLFFICVFAVEPEAEWPPRVDFVWFIDKRTSGQDLPWPLIIPLPMENCDHHSTSPWLIGLWVIFRSCSRCTFRCVGVCKVSRWSHPAADACSRFLNQNKGFAMMSAIRRCYTYA